MPRVYQPARLPDGSRNPKHKTRPTGKRGKKKNHFQYGEFCAWDGEGLTPKPDDHRYVLLCSSAGDAVWKDEGLGTYEIFSLVCARARALDKRTIHVVFGGSYDVNCWLRDLSPRALARVWRGGWVDLGPWDDPYYRVQYRARRSFVIHELKTGTRVTLWDVWGFFQGSFVGALEKYGMPVPDRLRLMKQQRRFFTERERQKIVTYCREECALLVELMKQVHEHLKTAELPIRRWDGAGACAAALLSREKTQTHQGASPEPVRIAAQHAYAGGRIEMIRYGHAPGVPLHHYDINSAYPSALRGVPSLSSGVWRHDTKPRTVAPGIFAVHRVRWRFYHSTARAYPFFWRAPNGSIFYPPMGEGWYWSPEVAAMQAAHKAGQLSGEYKILESWIFDPSTDVKPFAFVDRLFEQRAQWKRDGIGAEKMLKLALNSLYGKCAQHVGGKSGEAPRYHQIEWAGWITSVTRSALFSAAMEAGPSAVMIATDGIFSTDSLPSCRVSKSLGDWEYHCHHGGTVVQSGVYWLDDEKATSAFSRGFDTGSLDRAGIIKSWNKRRLEWNASLTRFVTMGAVVSGHTKPEHWRQWRTVPRVLALTPTGTKRTDKIPVTDWKKRAGAHPAYGYIDTVPTIPAALLVGDGMSTRYPLPWVGDAPLVESADAVKNRFLEWEAMEE